MAKGALEGSSMKAYQVDPDTLVIVGVDTDDDESHPLYDERIKLPIDQSLVENIMALGVLEPVLVVKDKESGDAIVIDGRRRVLHTREANKKLLAEGKEAIQVPAILKTATEDKILGMSISANEQRLQDTPMTKARKVARMNERGVSDEDCALYFGVSRVAIAQWKKLLLLSKKVQKLVDDGKVSATAAAKLADLEKGEQEEALEELMAEGGKVSGRKTNAKKKKGKGDKDATPAPSKRIQKKLIDQWQSFESEISEDFIAGVRWAAGDLSSRSIKGLQALLEAEEVEEEEDAAE